VVTIISIFNLGSRGEILKPPGGGVPQTMVFRYKEIGDLRYFAGNIEETVMFLSKYSEATSLE
jgi:hypothetical protein